MTNSPLIASLLAALAANPDDIPLRLHVAELLLAADRTAEAISQIAQVLVRAGDNAQAQALMLRAVGGPAVVDPTSTTSGGLPTISELPTEAERPTTSGLPTEAERPTTSGLPTEPERPTTSGLPTGAERPTTSGLPTGAEPPAPSVSPAEGVRKPGAGAGGGDGVDWSALENELSGIIPPRFAVGDEAADADAVAGHEDRFVDVETTGVRIGDVGGMADVKKRLEIAFFGPMRNPQMRRLYGKSLRGGLMLYGPPGCGKTFLARAVAGELGAKFISVSVVDVLNMWIGNSERNLHEIFEAARRNTPCVLFLDEIDALGHKRSQMNSMTMRTLGNQLLTELDGVESNNDGVFVLSATNAPWDVDSALRRPGRFDRMVLVLPPDAPARGSIVQYHLRERPVANIDLKRIVAATADFSGADLAHLCDSAAEHAMHDSISTGTVRMIEQRDFDAALREIRPSTGPWMATARNVALFGNEGGTYDDLAAYLKKHKPA